MLPPLVPLINDLPSAPGIKLLLSGVLWQLLMLLQHCGPQGAPGRAIGSVRSWSVCSCSYSSSRAAVAAAAAAQPCAAPKGQLMAAARPQRLVKVQADLFRLTGQLEPLSGPVTYLMTWQLHINCHSCC
jgi:hypothetical protein